MAENPPYFDAFAYGQQAQGYPSTTQPQGHAHSHSASTNNTHDRQGHGGQQGQGTFRHPSASTSRSHPPHGMQGGGVNGEGPSHVGYQYPSHATRDARMQPPMVNYGGYRPDFEYHDTYISPPQSTHPADPSPDILYGSTPYLQSPALNPPNFSLDRPAQSGPSRHSHVPQSMEWQRLQVAGDVTGAGQGRSTPTGVKTGAAGTPPDTSSVKGKGKRAAKDDERIAGRTSIGSGLMGPPASASGAHIDRDMLLLQGYLNEIITLLPPYCANPPSASDTPNSNPDPTDAAVPSQSTSTPSGVRAPPPKPPKYLLARFARLSSQIKTALLTLGPHVSLASDFDPIPKRTERKMTRAEEEMESIRRRRDALLTKAREQGAAGMEAGPARYALIGPAQGSASGSRNHSRGNSVMAMDGRTSAPPLVEQYPSLDGRQNVAVGADGIRRDADMFTGSTDWPMPMRDYMAMPAGPPGYGMGAPGMDDGLNYTDRLPDLFDPSQTGAYGRMPLSLDMSGKNGLQNDNTDTSLPSYMFSMATHGDGSMSTPPSATLPGGNNGNAMPFDMAQLSDMAFGNANGNGTGNAHVPGTAQQQEGAEMHGMQMRENIAWLARTTQPPQPSIQSQTNGMMDRCHGCGVMTGEWMRGPDGPGSLCVSCGLHYAKLAKRKLTAEVAVPGP